MKDSQSYRNVDFSSYLHEYFGKHYITRSSHGGADLHLVTPPNSIKGQAHRDEMTSKRQLSQSWNLERYLDSASEIGKGERSEGGKENGLTWKWRKRYHSEAHIR